MKLVYSCLQVSEIGKKWIWVQIIIGHVTFQSCYNFSKSNWKQPRQKYTIIKSNARFLNANYPQHGLVMYVAGPSKGKFCRQFNPKRPGLFGQLNTRGGGGGIPPFWETYSNPSPFSLQSPDQLTVSHMKADIFC